LIKFLLAVGALALVVVALSRLLVAQGMLSALPSFFYPTLLFMILVTVVVVSYLNRVDDPGQYIQLFLLLTVVKLVACLSYCTVIVLKKRSDMKIDVIFFLLLYVAFTAVEVIFLYQKTSRKRP
jgi:hypothetical protein